MQIMQIRSNSSHPEWRAGLSDTILKGTHPRTIPAKFALIWFSGFRGEDLNVHGKEQFNMYSRFFCEIFLSADLYRLCKLGIF
jgi:hypothetical protein